MPSLKIKATCGQKSVVCHCPDAQCYVDCATQFLTVLGGMADAGAKEFFAAQAKKKAGCSDFCLSYHVEDDAGNMVFCVPEIKIPNASPAVQAQAGTLFDTCCAHPKVKKCIKP